MLCRCLYFSVHFSSDLFSHPEAPCAPSLPENTANYFQGTFLYILIVIVTTDLCRLILKHTLHPAWMYSRKAFVVTGAVCTLLIIGVSLYGIFNQWNIKTKTYDVKIDKQVKGMDSLKIVLLADIHFGYSIGEKHAGLLVKKINAEDPDLICIAGDIFDNEYEGIKTRKKQRPFSVR